jgi:hypothetical protein
MSNAWYIENPELLQKVQDDIKKYPTLHVLTENQTVFVRGSLQILNKEKTRVIDSFSIEIELFNDFPASLPVLRETAKRIPKIADRHFNIDETACLFVPEEREKYFPDGSSISNFIENCVRPFLVNQSLFEEIGEWPLGQRSHGLAGVLEYYQEKFGKDSKHLIDFYIYLGKKEIKGHWPCYCGSGKKMRKCHMSYIIYYRSKYQPMVHKDLSGKGIVR